MIFSELVKNRITKKTPIWIMRQAGRYLPEYKKLRSNFETFIDFCLDSDAASDATIQPIKRFGLDAAIIFSDILIIPHSIGYNVQFKDGIGPIISGEIEEIEMRIDDAMVNEVFCKVAKAIKLTKDKLQVLGKDIPVIGFAGSPWTVSSYIIEGCSSKAFSKVRQFSYKEEEKFSKLINLLLKYTIKYLKTQVAAGASVIKLFDSWAGVLTEDQYTKWVIDPTKKIVNALKSEYPSLPIIGFPRKSGVLYENYIDGTGVDIIAIDETLPLRWASEKLSKKSIIQGNMDNIILTIGDKFLIKKHVDNIMNHLEPGKFIFNLGHGILPDTKIENVEYLINLVQNYK